MLNSSSSNNNTKIMCEYTNEKFIIFQNAIKLRCGYVDKIHIWNFNNKSIIFVTIIIGIIISDQYVFGGVFLFCGKHYFYSFHYSCHVISFVCLFESCRIEIFCKTDYSFIPLLQFPWQMAYIKASKCCSFDCVFNQNQTHAKCIRWS